MYTAQHTREFRHPKTQEGAVLECNIRGPNNYVVDLFKGSETTYEGTPTALCRGGETYAKEAWKRLQDDLLSEGFEIVKTTSADRGPI